MLFQPLTPSPVTITGDDTITVEEHAGRLIRLSAAAGQAITLPAATGSGVKYRFLVATSITSNSTTIKAASADDSFVGMALLGQDSADTVVQFDAVAGTSDTISLNGGTTGGIIGMTIDIEDQAEGSFYVRVEGTATGTEATPFDATVS